MTSLSEQLLKLALPEGSLGRTFNKSRPSLLFDSKEAVLFDKDTIYALGLNGFEELCQMDNNLHSKFYNQLFSERAKDLERTTKTKEFNRMLDATINNFLMHISPHFLLRPTLKCLEWLIYRFHIHSFNVVAFLRCIVPYHATNVFVRAVQMIDPQEHSVKWSWLRSLQEGNESYSMLKIVAICSKESGFFGFVCDMMRDIMKEILSGSLSSTSAHHHITFFTGTVLGVIHYSKRLSDGILTRIIPLLLKAFQLQKSDFQALSLMVFSQLFVTVTLEVNILKSFVNHCLEYCLPEFETQLVQVILLLCETQKENEILSTSILRKMYMLKDFYETVQKFGIHSKSENLVSAVIQNEILALSGENQECNYLLKLVQEVNLSSKMQHIILKLLMKLVFCDKTDIVFPKNIQFCTGVLMFLQQRYSTEFDQSVTTYFDNAAGGDNVENFLEASYQGSTGSVVIGLLHPSPTIRIQTINIMSKLLSEEQPDNDLNDVVQNHIIRLLNMETDSNVVIGCIKLLQKHLAVLTEKPDEITNILLRHLFSTEFSFDCRKVILNFFMADDCSEKTFNKESIMKTLCVIKFHFDSLVNIESKKLLTSISKSKFLKKNSHLTVSTLKDPEKQIGQLLKSLLSMSFKDLAVLFESALLSSVFSSDHRFSSAPIVWFLMLACIQKLNVQDSSFPSIIRKLCSIVEKEINFQLLNQNDLSLVEGSCISMLTSLVVRDSISGLSVVKLCFEILMQAISKIGNCIKEGDHRDDSTRNEIFSLLLNTCQNIKMHSKAYKNTSVTIPDCGKVFAYFFQSFFIEFNEIHQFLVEIWTDDSTYPLPKRIQAIYMVAMLLKSSKQSKMGLDSSIVLPALLLALSSSESKIRSASIYALQSISALPSCHAVELAKFVCESVNEVQTDHNYLSQSLKLYFDDSSLKKKELKERQAFLKQMVNLHVVGMKSETKVSSFGLSFLKCLNEINVKPMFDTLLAAANPMLHLSDGLGSNENSFIAIVVSKAVNCNYPIKQLGTMLYQILSLKSTFLPQQDIETSAQYAALKIITRKRFSTVPNVEKQKLFHSLLEMKSSTTHKVLLTQVNRVLKIITVQAGLLKNEITACNIKAQISVKGVDTSENKELENQNFNILLALLEVLQHKKQISEPQDLLETVCNLLNTLVIERKFDGSLEYITQLLISCLLNLVRRVKANEISEQISLKIQLTLKLELVVYCIQQTENAFVHREAVLLLAESVLFFPDKIVHTIMSIFTFMGNSLLRRDDSYSFQVISQTIQSVIPALLQQKKSASDDTVVQILQVFVDAMPHIPTHRRLTILEELLNAVGPQDYVWKIMILLIDQQFSKPRSPDKEAQMETNDVATEVTSISLEGTIDMCQSFSHIFTIDTQINSIEQIVGFLQQMPNKFETRKGVQKCSQLMNFDKMSAVHICNLRLASIILLSKLLSIGNPISNAFQCSEKTSEEILLVTTRMENFESILLKALQLNEQIVNLKSQAINLPSEKSSRYYDVLYSKMNETLDKITQLLPTGTMLLIVSKLLERQSHQVHLKVIQIFTRHISYGFKFSNDEALLFQNVARHLTALLVDDSEDQGSITARYKTASATALTRIVKICGSSCSDYFVSLIPVLCEFVSRKDIESEVLAPSVLCLGELFTTLKAYCIAHLARVCPCLLKLLGSKHVLKNAMVLHSLVKTVYMLFSSVSNFLSPHLVGFLCKLTPITLIHGVQAENPTENTSNRSVKKRKGKALNVEEYSFEINTILNDLFAVIAKKTPSRILIPAFSACYKKILAKCPLAARFLVEVVNVHLASMGKAVLSTHSNSMFNLLLEMSEFRETCQELSLDDLLNMEKQVVEGIVNLCLKLPEEEFQVLFHKLSLWGCSSDSPLSNATTFYHCMNVLASKLKGIFSPFATQLVPHFAVIMEAQIDKEDAKLISSYKFRMSNAAEMFATLMQADDSFVNQERFDKICEPLVDEIEKSWLLDDSASVSTYISSRVIPLIGQLAASSHNRIAWQPLHHNVLMKMRHSAKEVRCFALDAVLAIGGQLGQDYMAMIPDTIPFLAELMEDEDSDVEKHCHKVATELESVVGESLQKFF